MYTGSYFDINYENNICADYFHYSIDLKIHIIPSIRITIIAIESINEINELCRNADISGQYLHNAMIHKIKNIATIIIAYIFNRCIISLKDKTIPPTFF